MGSEALVLQEKEESKALFSINFDIMLMIKFLT